MAYVLKTAKTDVDNPFINVNNHASETFIGMQFCPMRYVDKGLMV